MELIFQTKEGAQLYAVIEDSKVISLHSADAHKIEPALKQDLHSDDPTASCLAGMLLSTIKVLGIQWIEG
jgi:hypothetical protein